MLASIIFVIVLNNKFEVPWPIVLNLPNVWYLSSNLLILCIHLLPFLMKVVVPYQGFFWQHINWL